MKQSTSSRRQPLVVMITTAGTVRECIFDDMYVYACEVADGIKQDDTFLPILYELDAREEWTDPRMWFKANPGLGVIKQFNTLVSFVERAKNNPADLPGVLCKDFNVRENSASSWLSFEEINNTATFDISEIEDTYAIGGCDLSATTDLTCASLLIRKPGTETIYVLQQYFLPQARVELLEEKNTNEAPYRVWAERGLLTICPGNRVIFSDVTAWFVKMRDVHRIDPLKIGYDRALAGYWVEEMQNSNFTMEKVAQGPFTFSQPMREMGAAFGAHIVNYNNNPILKWCLSNTAVKKSGLNNITPDKITDKRRIDGAVSLLNAWVVYVRDYDNYMYFVG